MSFRVLFACLGVTGVCALAMVGFSCSSRKPPARARTTQSPATPTVRPAVPAVPEIVLYDADGNLLETEARFMGFALPVGFERVSSGDGAFVYESRIVPYEKLGAYVEARLESSTLEVAGRAGLIYHNAQIRGAEMAGHRMEVRVFTIPGAVELWLRDQPPVVFPPGTTSDSRIEEVNRAWREDRH